MKTQSKQIDNSTTHEPDSKKQASPGMIIQAYGNGNSQLRSIELEEPAQQKENKTGLPDNLKSGVENLSGHSLDDVNVHYNSSQPAALQAHAYAQGTDIHVAPGQEKHLPHEAWHVVQQKEGRVKPTKQLKGTTNINDDAGLEKEADVMGAKAMQLKADTSDTTHLKKQAAQSPLYQLQSDVTWTSSTFNYLNSEGENDSREVGGTMVANLDPDDPIEGADAQSSFQKDMYDDLKSYWNPGAKHWVRGHLLNANLGGPNVAPNLFPITGYANGDHLNYVENHVKNWIIQGNKVKYTVDATQEGGTVTVGEEEVPNAAGSFDCTAEIVGGDKKISRLIKSEPVKREAKDAAIAAGHTSSWTRQEAKGDNLEIEEAIALWNEDQLNFVLFLLENDFDYKTAFRTLNLSLDDYIQITDSIKQIKESIDSIDEADDDVESEDTEDDKVGSRVTNAKLKDWLGKSLSTQEANAWLANHRDDEEIANVYSVKGKPDALDDDDIESLD